MTTEKLMKSITAFREMTKHGLSGSEILTILSTLLVRQQADPKAAARFQLAMSQAIEELLGIEYDEIIARYATDFFADRN